MVVGRARSLFFSTCLCLVVNIHRRDGRFSWHLSTFWGAGNLGIVALISQIETAEHVS